MKSCRFPIRGIQWRTWYMRYDRTQTINIWQVDNSSQSVGILPVSAAPFGFPAGLKLGSNFPHKTKYN